MAFNCSTDSREQPAPCDDSLDSVTVNSLIPPDGNLSSLGRLLLGRRSHLIALDMCCCFPSYLSTPYGRLDGLVLTG